MTSDTNPVLKNIELIPEEKRINQIKSAGLVKKDEAGAFCPLNDPEKKKEADSVQPVNPYSGNSLVHLHLERIKVDTMDKLKTIEYATPPDLTKTIDYYHKESPFKRIKI